jgi:hypothetical protein
MGRMLLPSYLVLCREEARMVLRPAEPKTPRARAGSKPTPWLPCASYLQFRSVQGRQNRMGSPSRRTQNPSRARVPEAPPPLTCLSPASRATAPGTSTSLQRLPRLAGPESHTAQARNRCLSHAQKIVKFSPGPDIDSGGQFCRANSGGHVPLKEHWHLWSLFGVYRGQLPL